MTPRCRFPKLAEPYDGALREAVAYVLSRFEPLGIIASGTIVRGDPGPTSDHDLHVIVPGVQRLRIQRFFNGVPAEIFINPSHALEKYFEKDLENNRPITAHMVATGFVVLDRDPAVERLRALARDYLARSADYDEGKLTWLRYVAALFLEDAEDIAESDPEACAMLLHTAVHEMLRHYFFARANLPVPRWKDLLAGVCEHDPEAGELARRFYRAATLDEQRALAGALADHLLAARGFFEWESAPEEV